MGTKKRRDIPRVPWITDSGTLDPTKFPIEPVLRQTLSRNFDEFRSGCVFLGTMAYQGRVDAEVYLLGLLQHYQDDLGRIEVVVEALGHVQNQACAAALFAELRRLKASNATRRYLDQVIRALARFPRELVEAKFQALAADRSFSYRMRAKFATILGAVERDDVPWDR
jgi:hypothetical protein